MPNLGLGRIWAGKKVIVFLIFVKIKKHNTIKLGHTNVIKLTEKKLAMLN